MRSPHILKAAGNPRRLRDNLVAIIDASALAAIDAAIADNVRGLFHLGRSHFDFARATVAAQWRQKVSRFYYSAYAISRAVRLDHDGHYSTDVKDHSKIDELPTSFPKVERYKNQLGTLRDDRNLADYDHSAEEIDLVISVADADSLIAEFLADATAFLSSRGVAV